MIKQKLFIFGNNTSDLLRATVPLESLPAPKITLKLVFEEPNIIILMLLLLITATTTIIISIIAAVVALIIKMKTNILLLYYNCSVK